MDDFGPSTPDGRQGQAVVGSSNADRIMRWAIGIILLLVIIVAALIVKNVFITPVTTPRNAIESDLFAFRDAIKKNPRDARAHLGLGLVYMEMGNYHGAVSEYKLVIKLNPKFSQAYYDLGIAYEKQNRMTDALGALKKALKIDKDKFELAAFEIGKIYYGQNKYSKASEYFNKSLKLNPSGADSHYYLGLIYEKNGDKTKAAGEFKAALKFIPDYKEARQGLQRVSGKK